MSTLSKGLLHLSHAGASSVKHFLNQPFGKLVSEHVCIQVAEVCSYIGEVG